MLWSSGEGNTFDQECGHAYPKDYDPNKGIWKVYFQDKTTEYLILNNGTDYDYYSAVYSCAETGEAAMIQETALILTRYKHPSFSQVISIHNLYDTTPLG